VKRALLTLALLLSTGEVCAQEYIPPPIVAPPPYQPFSYRLDQELAARGHRNKVAGAVLIAVGSLALAAGQVMVIWATTHPTYDQPDFRPNYCFQGGSCGGPSQEYDAGLIAGGVVSGIVGVVMNAVGIPVYAVGGSQMKRAQFRVTASGARVEF
jgi:hypothetical protein